jgi:hypothetical protein
MTYYENKTGLDWCVELNGTDAVEDKKEHRITGNGRHFCSEQDKLSPNIDVSIKIRTLQRKKLKHSVRAGSCFFRVCKLRRGQCTNISDIQHVGEIEVFECYPLITIVLEQACTKGPRIFDILGITVKNLMSVLNKKIRVFQVHRALKQVTEPWSGIQTGWQAWNKPAVYGKKYSYSWILKKGQYQYLLKRARFDTLIFGQMTQHLTALNLRNHIKMLFVNKCVTKVAKIRPYDVNSTREKSS